MTIKIISFIVAILLIILSYYKDNTKSKKEIKVLGIIPIKKLGFALLILSVLGLFTTSIIDFIDKKSQESDYNRLLNKNDSINNKLDISKIQIDSLKTKNDSIQAKCNSILYANELLKSLLLETKNEINYLQNKTIEKVNQNQESIEKVGQVAGMRTINPDIQKMAISILSQAKGKVHFELTSTDSEVINFAEQLRDLFKKSGWRVTNNYTNIWSIKPMYGVNVLFKKSDKFPVGFEQALQFFDLAKIVYKPFYVDEKDTRLVDWVYIQVGLK
jgi:hypothetical protein